MNILFLYNSTQTYTSTVFEHINCFAEYSRYSTFFSHLDRTTPLNVDLSRFDVVAIHYSVRLPFDQISESVAQNLERYGGLKVLFIQDEYDHTFRAWHWINRLGIRLVFTAVPDDSIAKIYPAEKLPGVRFVNNLTGYVPENLKVDANVIPASQREIIFGYRGRPLPIRYGALGVEKFAVGKIVKEFCESRGIRSDIAWSESERIYGPKWYEFLSSCRAILGSESGSNVFDWDNSLPSKIESFKKANTSATDEDVYRKIVEPVEISGLMNQISPRVFETIAAGAALVLFEGNYSGLLKPWKHFLPLKKNGSNLDEILRYLQDRAYVDELTQMAVQDIILPGKYSYRSYVSMVDGSLDLALEANKSDIISAHRTSPEATELSIAGGADTTYYSEVLPPTSITTKPILFKLPTSNVLFSVAPGPINPRSLLMVVRSIVIRALLPIWGALPLGLRRFLKPRLQKLRYR